MDLSSFAVGASGAAAFVPGAPIDNLRATSRLVNHRSRDETAARLEVSGASAFSCATAAAAFGGAAVVAHRVTKKQTRRRQSYQVVRQAVAEKAKTDQANGTEVSTPQAKWMKEVKFVDNMLIGLLQGNSFCDRKTAIAAVLEHVRNDRDSEATNFFLRRVSKELGLETDVEQGDWWEFKGKRGLSNEELWDVVTKRIEQGNFSKTFKEQEDEEKLAKAVKLIKTEEELREKLRKTEADLKAKLETTEKDLKAQLQTTETDLKGKLQSTEKDLKEQLRKETESAQKLTTELSEARKIMEASSAGASAKRIQELEQSLIDTEASAKAAAAEEIAAKEVSAAKRVQEIKMHFEAAKAERDVMAEEMKKAAANAEEHSEMIVQLQMSLEEEKMSKSKLQEHANALQASLDAPENEVRAQVKELEKSNKALKNIEEKYNKAMERAVKAETREDEVNKALKDATKLARKMSKREKLPTKEGGFFSKPLELQPMLERLAEVHVPEESD